MCLHTPWHPDVSGRRPHIAKFGREISIEVKTPSPFGYSPLAGGELANLFRRLS